MRFDSGLYRISVTLTGSPNNLFSHLLVLANVQLVLSFLELVLFKDREGLIEGRAVVGAYKVTFWLPLPKYKGEED